MIEKFRKTLEKHNLHLEDKAEEIAKYVTDHKKDGFSILGLTSFGSSRIPNVAFAQLMNASSRVLPYALNFASAVCGKYSYSMFI